MGLIVVGLSHHTAPVDLRERVAYSKEDAIKALQQLRADALVPQALLLSTCNRTELYALAADDDTATARVREVIFRQRMAGMNGGADGCLYGHTGQDAVRHLYRVVCGLDSMVLGEAQILGQVKNAYEVSREAHVTGTVLHRLVNGAVRLGKRARTETEIGSGTVSVASIAVEVAEKVFQDLKGKRALLVGAGENGKVVAQHLRSRDIARLQIANRTLSRAEALADELGGEAIPFDRIAEALAETDVVVSTTGASEPVITRDMVRRAKKLRGSGSLVLLDIAVPRDIDPAVDHEADVFRFDLDALQGVVDQNFERRRSEIPAVEKLVDSEVDTFLRFWASLDAGPVIRDLHNAFEALREAEVAKNAKRFTEEDREQLETFSRSLVQKLLAGVTQEIKTYKRSNPVEMERLAALRQMFHLRAERDPNPKDGESDELQ